MQPGRVAYDSERNQFVVHCLPHVAIKLRRVFGGVQRGREAGVFRMSASPTNAHELDWFRQRYPLDLEPGAAVRFAKLVETEQLKLKSLDEIQRTGYIPPSFELALPPREYQRAAADMALRTGRLLLADDLGVGKTVSSLCALVAPGMLPALVVTLTSLPTQSAPRGASRLR